MVTEQLGATGGGGRRLICRHLGWHRQGEFTSFFLCRGRDPALLRTRRVPSAAWGREWPWGRQRDVGRRHLWGRQVRPCRPRLLAWPRPPLEAPPHHAPKIAVIAAQEWPAGRRGRRQLLRRAAATHCLPRRIRLRCVLGLCIYIIEFFLHIFSSLFSSTSFFL